MHRLALPHRRRAGLIAAAALASLGVALAPRLRAGTAPPSFAREIQPLLSEKCTACHPVSYPYLDLRPGRAWRQLVRVPAATNPAFDRVLPGRPELSYLLTHPVDPSNARLLTAADRELLRRWIAAGAPDN